MGFPKKREKAEEITETAGSAEPGAQRSAMWSPYDEGPRSRGPLWFLLGGVVVLGLLGGGLAFMWNMKGPEPTQSAARRTSAPLPSAPPGEFGFAGERATDPEPLTVKELYGKKKTITQDGRTYVMTITKKDKKCGDAVSGDKLQKALKAGKCTQVLRASFRDKAGNILGTVGVANLKSSRAATKVASVIAKGKQKFYVKALPGKDAATKLLGSGEGGINATTHGHYAIMTWFQNKDGKKPDKKGLKRLAQATDDVMKLTVFKALDSRSLSGQPAV